MTDPEDTIESIRDLLFVQAKVVTTGYVSKEYGLHPVEARNILLKLIESLKDEGREKDVINSYTITGYAKEVSESDDLKILKVLEVDEDEVDSCKSSFFSTVEDVVLKSIREKNVSRKDRTNFAVNTNKISSIRSLSDLESMQAFTKVEDRLSQLSQKSLTTHEESEREFKKEEAKKKDEKKSNIFSKKSGSKRTKVSKKKEPDSDEEDDVVREGDVDSKCESDINGKSDSNGKGDVRESDDEEIEKKVGSIEVPLKEIQIKDESSNKKNRQITIDSDEEDEEPVSRKKKVEKKATSSEKTNERKKGKKEEAKKRKRIMILSDSEEEEQGEESEEEVTRKKPTAKKNKKKNVLSDDEDDVDGMEVEEERNKKEYKMNGKVKATGPYDPHSVVEEEITEVDEDGFTVTKKVKISKKDASKGERVEEVVETGEQNDEVEEEEVAEKEGNRKGNKQKAATKEEKKEAKKKSEPKVQETKKKATASKVVKAPAPGTRKITDFFSRPKGQ